MSWRIVRICALQKRSSARGPGKFRAPIRFHDVRARLKPVCDWGVPKVRALFEATYFVGLRKAGMPEE